MRGDVLYPLNTLKTLHPDLYEFHVGKYAGREYLMDQKIPRAVTEIIPAQTFWRAEEYHQQYLDKRGQSHCGI